MPADISQFGQYLIQVLPDIVFVFYFIFETAYLDVSDFHEQIEMTIVVVLECLYCLSVVLYQLLKH